MRKVWIAAVALILQTRWWIADDERVGRSHGTFELPQRPDRTSKHKINGIPANLSLLLALFFFFYFGQFGPDVNRHDVTIYVTSNFKTSEQGVQSTYHERVVDTVWPGPSTLGKDLVETAEGPVINYLGVSSWRG